MLHSDVEKNQQAQQLGCIDEKDVDAWFDAGTCFPGAIDMRCHGGSDEEERARTRALEAGLEPGKACRWGVACPRLSTDAAHTAAAHTAAQAAESGLKGGSTAVCALGGRWP